jgi:predicted LPLAT superfamily acyltransferase
MKTLFYKSVMALSRRTGAGAFLFFAWFVATGYFLFFPTRVAVSVRFYRALFPQRNRLYHLWCSWRQYHHFTSVYLDRFLLQSYDDTALVSRGFDLLVDSVAKGKGAIVLMSHMGNWDVAAHWMKQKGMKVLLYVGRKYKEQIEGMQKESLTREGIRLIAVDQDGGSPFDLVEGVHFLEAGGVVSMTGDRLWSMEQRSVTVRFLGHEALLPESPHLFALLSGAPIHIFFVFRDSRKQYRTIMLPPRYVVAASRRERQEAIRQSAQWYADRLAEMARQHPFEWYHFEPFLKQNDK